MSKLKAAVLGATGMVGQKFIQLLEGHPWFELTAVAASERSQSKKYSEAARWLLESRVPPEAADLEVQPVSPEALNGVDVVFSALPAEIAGRAEEEFAQAGFIVLSNASSHRMDPDVPLLNPEVNADHATLIAGQRRRRRWEGAIVTNPNCTTAILTMSLKPLLDQFGISRVVVSTMQAISGAGYPGVAAMDIVDNIIPFIRNEEEKVERECLKILGSPERTANFKVSASCHRVAVLDGHTEAVFVETERGADPEAVAAAMRSFEGEPQRLKLPSATEHPIIVRTEEDRPQPRLDRMAGRGMAVVVGRIRSDPLMGGVKYVVVGHNTIRGAAGCSIINAEVLRARGYL